MKRSLALAAALLVCGSPAMARDLTMADMIRIERINQSRNADVRLRHLQPSDPGCSIFAFNKAFDLVNQGYGPGEVKIAFVTDEKGDAHAVTEVFGTLKGKPVVIVLDNRFNWTQSRADLEVVGYTWKAEFSL